MMFQEYLKKGCDRDKKQKKTQKHARYEIMQAFQITSRCCMSVLDFGVFRHDQLFKPVYSPACAASLLRLKLGPFKSSGQPQLLEGSLWPPCNQR